MSQVAQSTVFGRRKEPHTVIIARGDRIRHFTVRPWLAAFLCSALAAIAIGYLLATSYLVLRDGLIGAATARQARMQQAYEDRISALRSQVDRITSRQMLDQQLMETKVGELLARQSQLSQRHGRLGPLLDKADGVDALPTAGPLPAARPDERASAVLPSLATAYAQAGTMQATPFSFWSTRASTSLGERAADRADRMFVAINDSLRTIETEQMERVTTLAENAYQQADAISAALSNAGLAVDTSQGRRDVGGPYFPVDRTTLFDAKVQELDDALAHLDRLKTEVEKLPLANPAPGKPVSSTFGIRTDPLLGTPALHSGMDFRATSGTAAHVTAPGKVVRAGWNGGYGRMVEVDHGDGLATRYAHLSKILVSEGDTVQAGDTVGLTGSSGRSTGPHLHYEVRHDGEAVDPLRFLTAGRKVMQLL